MYTYNLKKIPKNTVEVEVTLSKNYLNQKRTEAFNKLRQDLVVEGFRKGNVPDSIAEKHIPENKIVEEMIKKIVPDIYTEIVKKENFLPIYNPKIEFTRPKGSESWLLRFTIPLKPEVKLGNYKESIKKIADEAKAPKIWLPGKNQEEEKETEQKKTTLLSQIFEVLLKKVEVEISDVILEEELNHRLVNLVDEVKKVGLTIEDYLRTKRISLKELKNSLKKEIEETYKLEFILEKIANEENIQVEEKDLYKLFNSLTSEEEKEKAKRNSYYYATLIRKQKTIDYLISLL
ncbi:MAG: hypothetical protein NZL96_03090 [Patescibacteria group bacterium]|nr:hypothetical protein [Patescibacteria group bacterium]